MSAHAEVDLDLGFSPKSPTGRFFSPHGQSLASTTLAVCHSSPPRPSPPVPHDSYFTVEELSDYESDCPGDVQILHPYELEEVESVGETVPTTPADVDIDQQGLDQIQDSDHGASPRSRASRQVVHASASPSPARPNPRKRSLSEVLELDKLDDASTQTARSEPPNLRRRILGHEKSFAVENIPNLNETLNPQAAPAWVADDLMDIDGQAV